MIAALVFVAACHARPTPPGGDVAASLALRTLDGAKFDPATLAGKPALVTFWRPGCPYCAEALPKDLEAAKRAGATPVAVMVAGGNAEASAELKAMKWDGPALVDHGLLLKQYDVEHVPYTFVLRPDGTADRVFDGDEASVDDLVAALSAAH